MAFEGKKTKVKEGNERRRKRKEEKRERESGPDVLKIWAIFRVLLDCVSR